MRELEKGAKENRIKMEAGFQEAIRILRNVNFDRAKFETVVNGHAARSNQRLKMRK